MNWDQLWKQWTPWGEPADDDEPDVMEGKRKEFLRRLDLALPAKVYLANRYRYPHESEEEAMRGDWEKIGADFRVSIEKAERETTAE